MPVFSPLTPEDPRFAGGYALRARLGAGGMGRVYLSYTPQGRPLAVKLMRPEIADDQGFRRRFRREIQAAQQVNGRYTAAVVDADPDADPPWLATYYVPGPTLHDAVAIHGRLPPAAALRLLGAVAEALAAIHLAGLVHRDLKPTNVILAADGPRVIDFGIAYAAEATALSSTGARLGTPAFMAPEQAQGRPVTAATDVFALGHLALFAATGRSAFGEGNQMAVIYRILHEPPNLTGCPILVRIIVERCLAKDPAERPGLDDVIAACRRPGEPIPWLTHDLARTMSDYQAPEAATHPPFPKPAAKTLTARTLTARTLTAYRRQDAANHPGSPATRPRRRRLTSPFRGMPIAVRIFLAFIAIAVALGMKIVPSLEHKLDDKYGTPRPAEGSSSAAPRTVADKTSRAATAPPARPEYAGVALTLPGGRCFVDTVELAPTGPQVDPRGLNFGADLTYNFCGSQPPALYAPDLGQAKAAVVSGTPDAAACSVTVDRQPMGTLTLTQLTAGTQICLKNSFSGQLAFFRIVGIDAKTLTLTMTATGWAIPGAS